MMMPILRAAPPPPLQLRFLARRFFSSSPRSLFRGRSHSISSFSPRSRSRLFFSPRVSGGRCSLANGGGGARAFMSSGLAAEVLKERAGSESYGSEQIQVLEGLDPVRKRPGMYIGSTGPRGLHHLVYEILDNAVDEAQAGYASRIDVVLLEDNSVSVTDNGRGIPIDLHPVTKKSSLETVLTVLHAGGKFGGASSGYSVSGGLHGVGLSVVNALSGWLSCVLNTDKKPLHDILAFRKEADGITVDAALQWCSDAYTDTILGYANSIRTIYGGTHIDGMKASLTRTINNLGKKSKVIKEKDINLSGEHVREGLTCIVSVKVPNPEFERQTKTRLGNPEVRRVVEQCIQEHVTEYLELQPDAMDLVLSKSLNALKAILPLRGKILNIERKDEATIYKNEEIQNLVLGLGLGVKGEDFKKEAPRYHKIIILTDADVDGAHIRTLLLTFFYRYQKALFDEGCIYVGVPPLYKVDRGKHAHYCYDEAELKHLLDTFPTNASFNIQRFKGLGEMMPAQFWETTLDPDRRLLKQLVVEDAAEANVVFSSLTGTRKGIDSELCKHDQP